MRLVGGGGGRRETEREKSASDRGRDGERGRKGKRERQGERDCWTESWNEGGIERE